MKKISIILVILLFVISQAFGQESKLYKEIQQAKNKSVNFKNVSIFQDTDADTVVLKEFINPNEVFFFESLPNLQSDSLTQAIAITIPMDTNNIVLELLEVPDYFYNYQVVTSSGDTFPANKDIKHYPGKGTNATSKGSTHMQVRNDEGIKEHLNKLFNGKYDPWFYTPEK